MPRGVIAPFNADVDAGGGYRYTSRERPSATRANARISAAIASFLRPGDRRVLDIGCGDGTYTAELLDCPQVESVLGIDPAESAVERARRLYGTDEARLEFRACLSGDLAVADGPFDLAIYRGVIHHVARPAEELRIGLSLARSLVVLEPNGYNLGLKVLERVSPYHRSHEERSYTLRRLRAWIERAGGRVARAEYLGLVPMFCPATLAAIGAAVEPLAEPIPLVRSLLCGQVILRAEGGGG